MAGPRPGSVMAGRRRGAKGESSAGRRRAGGALGDKMRDRDGRPDTEGIWWSPWPAGPGAIALHAALQARKQALVVPADGPAVAAGLRCFTVDAAAPDSLRIAAAAVEDRFGLPLGLVFLADPARVAPLGPMTAEAVERALRFAAALPALVDALAPDRPWIAIFPTTRGQRAQAGAGLALRGAVEGLAAARRAAGGRATVVEGPAALWSGLGGATLGPLLAQLDGGPQGAALSLGARIARKLRG